VEKGFSGFATRTTKRTTVLDAKLVEKFLRTADCPGYCDRTGRGRSKNSKPSSAARWSFASGGLAQFGLPGGFQQVSRHSQLQAARGIPSVSGRPEHRSAPPVGAATTDAAIWCNNTSSSRSWRPNRARRCMNPKTRLKPSEQWRKMQRETTRSHLSPSRVQWATGPSLNWVHQEYQRAQGRADPAGNHS